jgi:hypothetical protein
MRAAIVFASLTVGAAAFAAVGVNKSFNPISVSAGQVSTLTIVLLKPNAAPATGLRSPTRCRPTSSSPVRSPSGPTPAVSL